MKKKVLLFSVLLLCAVAVFAQALNPLIVSKTVSTSPPSFCGNDTIIAVPAGTQVYYCYSVFNPNDSQIGYTLDDDVLGLVGNTTIGGFTSQFFWLGSAINVTTLNVATATSAAGISTAAAEVVIQASSVPTLSDLGLVALGLGVLGVSLLLLRRSSG